MVQHVLLIEDEPNIAEAIRFLLTRDGLRVSHAAEGAAALVLLRHDPPDLLILDHMLPGMSGLEILTAVRADPESRDLPVMMLTARGRDREMAEQAGADRFMTKPFSNAEMNESYAASFFTFIVARLPSWSARAVRPTARRA